MAKIIPLENVRLSPRIYDSWLAMCKEEASKYVGKKMPHIEDEQFRELPNGVGEVFCKIGTRELSLRVPSDEWAWS